MKALHKNSERNERIYEQRKLGRTLKSIGDEFGLSSERIRGLCVRHERLKINIKRGGVFLLSSSAQSVIKFHEYDDDFENDSLAGYLWCKPPYTESHALGLRA